MREVLFKKYDDIKVTLNRNSTIEETMKENCKNKAKEMVEEALANYKSRQMEKKVKME